MDDPSNPAVRRYVIRLAVATLFYLATLFLAVHFVGHGHVGGPLAVLLALLPGIAVTGMFWAFLRLVIEQRDEYQRLLLVRQALVATGFTFSLVTIWGFLENFGMVPHVDAFYVAMLWFFGLAVGKVYNRFTLGDGGCA